MSPQGTMATTQPAMEEIMSPQGTMATTQPSMEA